jgi:hypothetical protein
VAQRIQKKLELLGTLVPPRVRAAYFGTLWNRWATARRFQKKGKCVLHCSETAEDSIEHYVSCSVVRRFAQAFLRLQLFESGPKASSVAFMAGPGIDDCDEIIRRAVLVYAVYMATNMGRVRGNLGPMEAAQAMGQFAKEAVAGHVKAMAAVDSAWAGSARSTQKGGASAP